MNDTDVRKLLARVADEVPATPVDPEPLLRRGYRRMARTAFAGALGIACAIVVAVGGIGLIRSSAPTSMPAHRGQPTESPSAVTGDTTGTWTGPCADSQDGPPPWGCFGPLEEGTYTSQSFEPALTFTVPAGWNNPWDTGGEFDLWTPGWSDGAYMFGHPGLHVVRDPRPEGSGADATVGTSALELATWVANRPGIATAGPSPVEIGGLAGYQLDVSIAETWHGSCGDCAGLASVSLFEASGDEEDGIWLVEGQSYGTIRLILLDVPDGGTVVIAIDGNQVDAAMPVVDSFAFDLN
jgi:hypothetical protein